MSVSLNWETAEVGWDEKRETLRLSVRLDGDPDDLWYRVFEQNVPNLPFDLEIETGAHGRPKLIVVPSPERPADVEAAKQKLDTILYRVGEAYAPVCEARDEKVMLAAELQQRFRES